MKETVSIRIDRLQLRACHGVMAQERIIGNDYEVSVELSYPPAIQAAKDDDLAKTVNYADIVEIVKAEMARPSKLLENVAYRIRRSLEERYPECWSGRVEVTKIMPPIPNAQLGGASVVLTW